MHIFTKEKLDAAARRIRSITEDVRTISNDNESPLNLREALTNLERAEALLLETARS